jgi:hypothetical protein
MADFFLDDRNAVARLVDEWRKYKTIIIAYDYDDTVFDFHGRGVPYDDVIHLLQRCANVGAHFIVFTCCGEDQYEEIHKYLFKNSIPHDAINENLPFIPFTGRKVYYNILLDDRAGLSSAYHTLLEAVIIMEKELSQ